MSKGKPLVQQSIDELLEATSSLEMNSSLLPTFSSKTNSVVSYTEIKDKASDVSKRLMNSLLKFYLSNDLIENNEYIKLKANIDMMTHANLNKQLQISERAIDTLMRAIDEGEVGPRMFEVLGGMQKTMLDIMKHQTLHMMSTEESMKKLKRDVDIYQDQDSTKSTSKKQDGNVTRGTRNLMMEIQAELNGENEDITIDEEFEQNIN